MHILSIFLNNEVRTGGHRRLLELCSDLSLRGNRVTVILNRDLPDSIPGIEELRIPCVYRRKGFLPVSVAFARAVSQAMPKIAEVARSADLIMVHGETHFGSALLLKRRFGLPVFYAHRSNTVRESILTATDRGNPLILRIHALFDIVRYRLYEQKLARFCDLLTFQSPYDQGDFCSRNAGIKEKTCVIRGNIGLPRFKPKTASGNRSRRLSKILFVGNLGIRKGLRHLLRAMELLAERGITDIELDVIGPGSEQAAVQKWIDDRNLGPRIRLHGRVTNPFEFIAATDLMVIPSDFDSYPDTVLESLHVGTPVIGSRTGGIPDMLEAPELLFPVQNPSSIADIIEHAYRDPVFYQKLKALCAARLDFFHFDWAEQWEEAANGLIESGSTGSEERKSIISYHGVNVFNLQDRRLDSDFPTPLP